MSPAVKIQRWLAKIKGRDTSIHPCGLSWAALAATHEHCEAAALLSYIKKGFPAARKETLGTVPCAAAREQQPEQSLCQLRERQMLGAAGDAGGTGTATSARVRALLAGHGALYPLVGTTGRSWPWSGASGKDTSTPELAGTDHK